MLLSITRNFIKHNSRHSNSGHCRRVFTHFFHFVHNVCKIKNHCKQYTGCQQNLSPTSKKKNNLASDEYTKAITEFYVWPGKTKTLCYWLFIALQEKKKVLWKADCNCFLFRTPIFLLDLIDTAVLHTVLSAWYTSYWVNAALRWLSPVSYKKRTTHSPLSTAELQWCAERLCQSPAQYAWPSALSCG